MVFISLQLRKKIARLSFVAAVLVVYLHWYSKPLLAAREGVNWWIQEFVSQGVTRIAVPYFLFVFGFLLFKDYPSAASASFDLRSVTNWWGRKVLSRVKSLLVPYLLWSSIGLVSFVILAFFVTRCQYAFEWGSCRWWMGVFGVSAAPTYGFHLWFIRAIFIYTLLAPLFAACVKRFPFFVLMLTFSSSLLGWPYWLSVGLFYVSLGIFASFHPELLDLRLSKSKTWLLGVVWLVGVLYRMVAVWNGWYADVLWLVNVVGVLFFWFVYDLTALDKVDKFCGAAFFVYCVHPYVYSYLGAALKRITFLSDVPVLNPLLPPCLNVCFSVTCYLLLKRFMPRVQRVLCGGR